MSDSANRAAIALASSLHRHPLPGVAEVVPNLVSVLLRYDPLTSSPSAISGELRLRLFGLDSAAVTGTAWTVPVIFDGPDLDEVAALLGVTVRALITAHNAAPLRVLATGFAPGFVYCGLHPSELVVPRRTTVRPPVPAGSVLFAAGQTAITATEMPTGWHILGRTKFANFDPTAMPPTRMLAGDTIRFEVAG
ncbi:5-oxoprolinase subunit B family protein [Devosia sp. SL43]|uniref:5-oxoprolinase subunit B family protein n=1 Tax=Devosia sp. SL43 TaxID=2806348 RepID=UPI001F1C842B|nr:carboxyltransferase domain-containing protein [Devosia sp. SL43]